MEKTITKCRICGNENLDEILDLGVQYLSGIFPKTKEMSEKAPLVLVKCSENHSSGDVSCGHIQLKHTYSGDVMYGENYGYRSGLNNSMIKHLKENVEKIQKIVKLEDNDIVLDIAGNDGTLLGLYPDNVRKINIDPTSEKFSKFSPQGVEWVSEFFSKDAFIKKVGTEKKAKVVTAFSMFYDLENPVQFISEVKDILSEDGILVLEQSYMPRMHYRNSYDTVCHEHLSYYGLRQLKYILYKVGIKIVDYEWNDCNGGSILVFCAHQNSKFDSCDEMLNRHIFDEIDFRYYTNEKWDEFRRNIEKSKSKLLEIISNKKVAALGASTKGNVLLQYCGIDSDQIKAVGDVNPDKHGCFTPGSWIPIVDEDVVLNDDYDLYVVLPWHFRDFFVNNSKFKGKTLVFPLPEPEIVVVE